MRAALAYLLVLLAVVGCQPTATVGGKDQPKRNFTAVSLSPSTTELVLMYAAANKLIGRTSSCNFPTQAASIPIVATTKPDYDRLTALSPGTIVYDAGLYSPADINKLKSLGSRLIEVKGNTIDEFCDSLYDFGRLMHAEMPISEYVDNIIAARTTAVADPLPADQKVAILLPDERGLGYMAATGSFFADEARAAGAQVVGPPGTAFLPVNVEAFLQMNPAIVVIAVSKESAGKAVDALLHNAQLQSVKAIRDKKIVPLDQDVMLRRGARVDKLIDTMHRYLKKAQTNG